MAQIKPYGTWQSPVTPDSIVKKTIRLGLTVMDNGDCYWLEGRPEEKGRNVIMKADNDNRPRQCTPDSFNVRTRVHEYGGGAFTVKNKIIYFVNDSDGRIYRQQPGENPEALSPPGAYYYADMDICANRLIAVEEEHTATQKEPINRLVCLDIIKKQKTIFSAGHDFYASPRFNRDGNMVSYLCWDHPRMPWDSTKLYQAAVDQNHQAADIQKIAGDKNEAVFQNQWAPDNRLFFVSDRNGYLNLYCYYQGQTESLYPASQDFGKPPWVFGRRTYDLLEKGKVVAVYIKNGSDRLAVLDYEKQTLTDIDLPYTSIEYIRKNNQFLLFKAGQPDQFTAVVKYDLKQKKSFILRRKSELQLDTSYISRPKHVPFTTGSDDKAYLFYYPPRHPDYQAPPHTSPPLLVKTHGGPTSAALNTLDMRIQFWTSRGFAVADINYRGSTGYGKNFKDKLNKQWGIADVEDCARAASFLAKVDLADKNKIAIAGRSAGGFTTLAALTLKNIFKAGICYYGISDLKALAEATHKFEAHYLDHLIGPCPEAAAEYEKRSPLKHVNKLSCPVIFFQGLEDKVVPPTQAGMMVKALQNKNIYVEYHTFAHEQHGFRRADTIKKCLELEYKFLMKVFYKQETDRA